MEDQLTHPSAGKLSPELRKALPVSLLFQGLILLFSAFVLDFHQLLLITVIAIAVFWAWFGFLVFLRGEKPLAMDIYAVKWGFPAIWLAVVFILIMLPDAAFLPAK